jgi:hypothetical protein
MNISSFRSMTEPDPVSETLYISNIPETMEEPDSTLGMVTGYGLDDRGGRSWSPGRIKNFLFSKSSRPALRSTQHSIQWVQGALSLAVKRPGREADHSPPASAEVKKLWIYTSTPPYAFMAQCLIR